MARAVKSIFVWLRNDCTGEVGTFLAIRYKCVFSRAQKQASIMSLGIAKGFGAADGKLIDTRDLLKWRLAAAPAPEIFGNNPKLAGSKCQAN